MFTIFSDHDSTDVIYSDSETAFNRIPQHRILEKLDIMNWHESLGLADRS